MKEKGLPLTPKVVLPIGRRRNSFKKRASLPWHPFIIWSKRIRTFACRYQKPMPYHLAILHRPVLDGRNGGRGKGEAGLAVQGRGDIASKQQGSPFRFRTDYNKLATLIERNGKLSALFACNAMPIKVGEGFLSGLILVTLFD